MPEIRKDPTKKGWVIISTERAKRPGDFSLPSIEKKGGFCPFCEGNEKSTPPEVFSLRDSGNPDAPGWLVRVVPNKFPALRNAGMPTKTKDGIFEAIDGAGAHEVIIETADHEVELSDLDPKSFSDVIATYRSRILKLKNDPRLEYIIIFRNSGLLAGASLEHPHTQLIGLPAIPSALAEELEISKDFYDDSGQCLFCNMIHREMKIGKRVVIEDDGFIAICPYAPRFPFETWVFPEDHASNFENTNDEGLQLFSRFFKSVLTRFKNVLNNPPYNFMLHTAPLKGDFSGHFHWHIEITPCLTHIAGFERGTGYYINPTPPEQAAEYLKGAGS